MNRSKEQGIVMAKISPVSIKYMVRASFKAEGPLEKPDVIGAIFGQTEGLLGSELEMRELQKEGKIGRIEVELETVDGKSVGEIKLPSALDKSETTIIAAALETIDRIGPTEASIQVLTIEDVRGTKRDFIIDRAKKLLEGLDEEGSTFGEMSKTLKEESRAAKLQEYGEEKLPAGDVSGKELIVVEGRADVITLLKNRVNNVIGMNGTKLPAEIARLGEQKELILFIDGDRGGRLIAQNVINNAKVTYVAIAPDGKEVEELTGKEILIALRKRLTVSEFFALQHRQSRYERSEESATAAVPSPGFSGDAKEALRKIYGRVKGTKNALVLDSSMDVIRQVSSKEITRTLLGSRKPIFALVIDGAATASTIKACDERNVQYCAATTFGSTDAAKVHLVSL